MATPTSNSVTTFSVNPFAAGLGQYLVYGEKWGAGGLGTGVALTFSFPQVGAAHISGYGANDVNEFDTLTPLDAASQAAVRNALTQWSRIANFTFTEVADTPTLVGELRFGLSGGVSPYAAAHAYLPGNYVEAGDVWINPDEWQSGGITPGEYNFIVLLHEIGHSLGLKHSFSDAPVIPPELDSFKYTIMSYTAFTGSGNNYATFFPSTPMYYDMVAMQALYGANTNYATGDNVYQFNQGSRYFQTIYDAGGSNDEIRFNGTRGVEIDLREGQFSSLSDTIFFSNGVSSNATICIGPNTIIERATGGSGGDTLIGNSANNILDGAGGFDTAQLDYSARNEVIVATLAGVTANGASIDTLLNIERLNVKGGSANDSLTGGSEDDILDGGVGADTMSGGSGSDRYYIDNAGDTIVEGSFISGGGYDYVYTTLTTYMLPLNIDDFTYLGAGNITITGSATTSNIRGGVGNDTLIGGSGGGALSGGSGNDVLWFNGNNSVFGGAGFDYAIQLDSIARTETITDIEIYVGGSGGDVLNGQYTYVSTIIDGGAGNDFITLGAGGGYIFGGDGIDTLIGNSAQDILLGGAGRDNLLGQEGNDVLYIDAEDGQQFDGGTGIDYAIVNTAAAMSVTLAGHSIEVFIGNLGNDVIDASGTTDAMGLYGFGGDDFIVGGDGASQLFGQNGNDTLVAGTSSDVLLGGDGNDVIYGNIGYDLLVGEVGDDTLIGGLGSDTLWGGAGADVFRVNATEIGSGQQDLIADFDASDRINFVGVTQSQLSIINVYGGAQISIAGGYTLIAYGVTAANIQGDLLFS